MHTAAAVLARANTLTATPREWIVHLPAGEHDIACTVNGKPKRITARNTATGAAALQRDLAALHASGKRLFIDFEHKGETAAGWVEAFRWDAAEGIQAKINWSAAGRAAVEGGDYVYYSPEWQVDLKTGECLGLMPRRPAGGLVNLPAFEDMAAVTARLAAVTDNDFSAAAELNQNTNEEMKDKLIAAAIARGIITQAQADSPEAVTHFEAAITALQTSAATAAQAKAAETTHAAALAAAVQAKEAAETELTTLLTATAKKVVGDAQARGAIPPQDKNTEAFWMTQCAQPGAAGATARQTLEAIGGTLPKPTGAGATAREMGGEDGAQDDAAQERRSAAVQAKCAELRRNNPNMNFDTAFREAQALVP